MGSKVLRKYIDYIVSYENNINVGTAKAIIKGTGNYGGEVIKTFQINKIPMNQTGLFVTLTYDFKDIDIEKFKENSSDGVFTIENGKVKATYLLENGKNEIYIPKEATDFRSIEVSRLEIFSVNNASISFEDKELIFGTDYGVEYLRFNNIKYLNLNQDARIIILGKGNYTGIRTIRCVAK